MTLTAGQPAPSFTLPSSDGGTLALDDLRGTIVVLYFYPKDDTPGCTIEAQDFRDALPALRELGATVLGVSKDSIASHCRFRDKYQLTFPLLSDADGAVLTAYGAWGEKNMYGKIVTGIIRSTVLIGADGTVVRHWPKVSAKGHAAEVVAAVRALTGAPEPEVPAATAAPVATTPVAPPPAATPKRAARKPTAARVATAKKATVVKKPAAKVAPKGAKKAAPKKAAAKKPAAKKAAPKKTAAKGAKKTTAKKPATRKGRR